MHRTLSRLRGFVGACFALLLIFPVWLALLFGRIQLIGSKEARAVVRRGKVLIVSNHPSLIETIALPALFWHWQWLGLSQQIPWSLADERLFGRRGLWLYPSFRCIPVRRVDATLATFLKTVRALRRHFESGGSAIVYPESGRTCKGTEFHTCGERRVRSCNPSALQAVYGKGVTLLTVWVEHGSIVGPESMLTGYRKLFFGPRMSISFARAVRLEERHLEANTLAMLMLATGHESDSALPQPAS